MNAHAVSNANQSIVRRLELEIPPAASDMLPELDVDSYAVEALKI
jgi:hypothetical protein